MLFNSFFYILLFLPCVLFGYYTLSKYLNYTAAKLLVVFASLFFYGWWNPRYLKLLALTITVNFCFGFLLQLEYKRSIRQFLLISGVVFNLGLLMYFKYTNFFIDNLNNSLNTHIVISNIILPLGISFFTFTQIAFIVDVFKNKVKEVTFLNYVLFVSYFPHLLAGPIIHHAQMMPQFSDQRNGIINYQNIYFGLILFIIGLIKKVAIADTLAIFVNQGYSHTDSLTFTTAWITSFAYTFQIYFDFSGYTDMAIGASRLFNIELPKNFNSPYKATSIRDFWHRWHITLSNFLRDYLYIPLGGNRVSELNIYRNLILTFTLGGFWHGAGWSYICWGLAHGIALSVHRFFSTLNIRLPSLFAWFITFNFVNLSWIFFRSQSLTQAMQMFTKMFSISDISVANPFQLLLLVTALLITALTPNSEKIADSRIAVKAWFIPLISSLLVISFILMEISNSHEFIYFQF